MSDRKLDPETADHLLFLRFWDALFEADKGDETKLRRYIATFPLDAEQREAFADYSAGRLLPKRTPGRPVDSIKDERLHEALWELQGRRSDLRAKREGYGTLKSTIVDVAREYGVEEDKLADLWDLGVDHNARRREAYKRRRQ